MTEPRIDSGMKILSAEGKCVGVVSEVMADAFKVHVRFSPDFWLGHEIVDYVAGDVVQLPDHEERRQRRKAAPRCVASTRLRSPKTSGMRNKARRNRRAFSYLLRIEANRPPATEGSSTCDGRVPRLRHSRASCS